MGTDIHTFIERKNKDGEWVTTHRPYKTERGVRVPKMGVTRNYSLFHFLAGVRYGNVGQAFEARGLPDDVSEPLRKMYGVINYHTPSYLTWEELSDVDWTRRVPYKRLVTRYVEKHVKKFLAQKTLKDAEVRIQEWERIVKLIESIQNSYMQTQSRKREMEIKIPLRIKFRGFHRKVMKRFRRLSDFGADKSDVRVVFWFDN